MSYHCVSVTSTILISTLKHFYPATHALLMLKWNWFPQFHYKEEKLRGMIFIDKYSIWIWKTVGFLLPYYPNTGYFLDQTELKRQSFYNRKEKGKRTALGTGGFSIPTAEQMNLAWRNISKVQGKKEKQPGNGNIWGIFNTKQLPASSRHLIGMTSFNFPVGKKKQEVMSYWYS